MAKYPKGLPRRYQYHWAHPWTEKARRSLGFRRWLKRNGYLTPHFRTEESRCKDAQRTPVPRRMSKRCRDHAFRLERFRHAVGDRSLKITSWYRTPAHNRAVGGAGGSKHMEAIATDFEKAVVDSVGRQRWFAAAEAIFMDGGVGDYPGGAAHLDSRGYRARWRSFVPGR